MSKAKKTYVSTALKAILGVAAVSAGLSGCGPGFPIMTGEQDALVQNVDKLMKENDSLKKRLSAVESGGGGDLKTELDGLKKALADANNSIDAMRQDLSYMKGGMEESAHQKDQTRESVKTVNDSVAQLNSRLSAIENSLKETAQKVESLKASDEANDKKISEMKEALASSDRRTAALEERSAAQGQPSQKARKDAKDEPEQLYLRAYRETMDKDFQKASSSFQEFLNIYPEHKYAGNAHYWLGEIYYAKGDWERAIIEFDKVVKKYPKGEKVAASMLKEGYAFERLGSNKEARLLLQEVVEKFPESPEAGLAKKRIKSMK